MPPHLDAAYNLARWLTGSATDAEDAVQDACVRALTFFDGFHGADGRAWLLAIVRNTASPPVAQASTRHHYARRAQEVDRKARSRARPRRSNCAAPMRE